MFPPSRSSFTSGTSATLTNPVASAETFQATRTVEERPGAEDEPDPGPQILPVALRDRLVGAERGGRDPRDERRREQERRGIDPVGDVGALDREQSAREDRAQHPRDVLDGREERGCLFPVVLADEVRERRPRGRPEEAGRDAVDRREDDDQAGSLDERQGDERRRADEVRDDHQSPAGQPVDERPEGDPDHDDRDEVRDQQGREPGAGARSGEDVDRERESREVRPDRGAGGRPEQQRKAGISAKRGQTASGSVGHARTLPPASGGEQWPEGTRAARARRPRAPRQATGPCRLGGLRHATRQDRREDLLLPDRHGAPRDVTTRADCICPCWSSTASK